MPEAATRRRTRWPSALAGAGALLAAGLAVTAVVRAATDASGPVLPYSLCIAGHSTVDLPPLTGARFLTSWQWAPLVLGFAVLFGVLYGAGVVRVGHGLRQRTWPYWRIASFYAGLTVAVVAVSGSVAVYDGTLFWAHMIQHLMLIMLAPPLLVIGRPLTLLVETSTNPDRFRRALRSWPVVALTSPGVALALYAAVIVGAHLTGLTDSILTSAWSTQIEQLTYLATGLLFFWLVFGDEPIPWQLSMPGKVLLLMVAMAVDTFVGVVLLETTKPVATLAHPSWGMAPLADTQAGGAVMWVGGDGLMAVMAIALFIAWTRQPRETRRLSVFEQARLRIQAERHSPEPAIVQPTGLAVPDLDEDDRELAVYNRWLANLNRRG